MVGEINILLSITDFSIDTHTKCVSVCERATNVSNTRLPFNIRANLFASKSIIETRARATSLCSSTEKKTETTRKKKKKRIWRARHIIALVQHRNISGIWHYFNSLYRVPCSIAHSFRLITGCCFLPSFICPCCVAAWNCSNGKWVEVMRTDGVLWAIRCSSNGYALLNVSATKMMTKKKRDKQ